MKIVHDVPPMLQAIQDAGMAPRLEYAAFCYGDELYIPGKWEPSEELLRHEAEHSEQQRNTEGGKDAWWERYIDDQYFRIEQEAQAYACQYDLYRTRVTDRNAQARYLFQLAGQLSGPMYGNVIPQGAAQKLIRDKAL